MKKIIEHIVHESIEAKKKFFDQNIRLIEECMDKMAVCLSSGHKILIFGNGGSAADAQHIAAEFVNRFKVEREPLAALALTTDTSIITSIGNDYDFDDIFMKQVAALGQAGDMAMGISTSGNSVNVIKAVEKAKNMGIYTVGMSGKGGKLAKTADLTFSVKSDTTARVQEVHITLAHVLCELVEQSLYPEKYKPVEKSNMLLDAKDFKI